MKPISLSNWFWCGLLLLSWIFGVCCDDVTADFEVGRLAQSFENGRRRMDEMIQRSKLAMNSGSCWKSVLSELEAGCKQMDEDMQSRLALNFASCFNEMMGLPPTICAPATPVKDCLRTLDDAGRSTFREYFLHTQDMCYYLRQEMWQDQTNVAVNRLTDAATDVTVQLFEQKYIQEQIHHSQQESLKVQTNMRKDNEDLYNTVVRVKDVFDDFSQTAREHQLISTEIFDKLSRMQRLVSWIQGEMSLFDMIFFYFGVMLFGYLATTTARTRPARYWLIILFMVSIFAENAVFKYLTQNEAGIEMSPEDVQAWIYFVRKIAIWIGCLIVVISGTLYRDEQKLAYNMLANMNFTLEKMLQMINDQAATGLNAESMRSMLNSMSSPSRSVTNDSLEDSSDDGDSFSDYSSDESIDNLEHELKALKETPGEDRENVEPAGLSQPPISSVFGKMSREQVRSHLTNNIPRRMYYFRERSAPRENPVIHQESVNDFARIVKRKKTPRPTNDNIAGSANSVNTNNASSRLNYFSSDDDEQ